MRTNLILLAVLAVFAIPMLGTDGCDDGGTAPAFNPDPIVAQVADGLREASASYEDASTFGDCVLGVVLAASADGTEIGIVVKQAIEGGTESGATPGMIIDPTPCVGLPGTPTDAEGANAEAERVAAELERWIPMARLAARTGAAVAMAMGDRPWCVGLTMTADQLPTAEEVTNSILRVIEEPGAVWTLPPSTWDLATCPAA